METALEHLRAARKLWETRLGFSETWRELSETSIEQEEAAGWPGLESLWTKLRGFAKRSNPGHPAATFTA